MAWYHTHPYPGRKPCGINLQEHVDLFDVSQDFSVTKHIDSGLAVKEGPQFADLAISLLKDVTIIHQRGLSIFFCRRGDPSKRGPLG